MELKNKDKNSRERVQQQFATARFNLLLMIAFTVLNIILLVLETDTMFLFSATVPYYAAIFGMIEPIILVPCIVIAAISIISYLLCWIFSKKHYGWMIAALVLFVIDTLALLGLSVQFGFDGILDLAIHAWVLWYLVIGVISGVKIKNLPPEEVPAEVVAETVTEEAAEASAEQE